MEDLYPCLALQRPRRYILPICALLFALGLICSLLAGYRISAGKLWSWLHILGFALITMIVVYVIVDAEYPRTGLIKLDLADQVLVDVRAIMK